MWLNWKCTKSQNPQILPNTKNQNVAKIKNAKCDQTQNSIFHKLKQLKCDKTQDSKCDNTHKIKIWHNLTIQNLTKLK